MAAAGSGAQAVFCAHIEDLCGFVRRRGFPRFTDFLDEHAQSVAEGVLRRQGQGCSWLWYGGYKEASRRLLGVFPKTQEPSGELFPLVALRTPIPKGFTLTHRDFLGAALALGIKREVVGDILITGEFAILFALPQAGGLICQELRQVGRVGVRFTEADAKDIHYTQRFEESEKSVASLRLDAVVAALLGCARSEAAERISQGLVAVGGLTEEKCTRLIAGGERISVRGAGKFIVSADGRVTRKGRQLIQIKRFV